MSIDDLAGRMHRAEQIVDAYKAWAHAVIPSPMEPRDITVSVTPDQIDSLIQIQCAAVLADSLRDSLAKGIVTHQSAPPPPP